MQLEPVRSGERQLFFMNLSKVLWGVGVGLSCSWLWWWHFLSCGIWSSIHALHGCSLEMRNWFIFKRFSCLWQRTKNLFQVLEIASLWDLTSLSPQGAIGTAEQWKPQAFSLGLQWAICPAMKHHIVMSKRKVRPKPWSWDSQRGVLKDWGGSYGLKTWQLRDPTQPRSGNEPPSCRLI